MSQNYKDPINPVIIYSSFEEFKKQELKSNSDTLLVMNFWATWCKPCVMELPHFEELNKKYKNQKIKVVLVSLDFEKDIETKLKPFLLRKNIQSKVIALTDSRQSTWIDQVSPEWSGALPASIFIKSGKFYFFEQDFETFEDLEKLTFSIIDR